MLLRILTAVVLTASALLSSVHAQTGGDKALATPAGKVVASYITAMVSFDWKTVAENMDTASLSARHQQFITAVKSSPTVDEERNRLKLVGYEEIRDMEQATPAEFFITERTQNQSRMGISPEAIKRKKDTLKFTILALAEEPDRKLAHAVVRATQETLDTTIDELLFITLRKDSRSGEYKVAPDLQQPDIKQIPGAAAPAAQPAAPAGATPPQPPAANP